MLGSVGWGLQNTPTVSLQRDKCSEYNTTQFDGEAPVMELWGMWSTPSLRLLTGSL